MAETLRDQAGAFADSWNTGNRVRAVIREYQPPEERIWEFTEMMLVRIERHSQYHAFVKSAHSAGPYLSHYALQDLRNQDVYFERQGFTKGT